MKIVLIYPDILKGANWYGYYYSGIGSLASSLIAAGHEVEFLHVTKRPEEHEFIEALKEKLGDSKKRLVAFSSTTNMYCFVEEWSAWIKKWLDVFIMAGGIHPTLSPEEVIGSPTIDCLCIGEGEAPLVELANAFDRNQPTESIANLWIKSNGNIFRNATRPLLKDLDSLPWPNRSLFDYAKLELEKNGRGVFMASRGCPYRCTYCCNEALLNAYGDRSNYVRFRSATDVILEIESVVREYPFVRVIHFNDDILPLYIDWFTEFATLFKERIGLPFECNLRPNLVNSEVVRLLKEAGCSQVRIGIESGNDHIRNKVLKRGLSREQLISAARMLKDAGILVYSFNMLGLPFEGPKEMLETIKLNAEIGFDESQNSIFEPFPKTKLYDVCEEQGLLPDQLPTDFHQNVSLVMPWMKRQRILFLSFFFRVLVKIYSSIFKLPRRAQSTAVFILDGFLTSRVTAIAIMPVFNRLYRFIRGNNWLDRVVRSFYRKLVYRDEH